MNEFQTVGLVFREFHNRDFYCLLTSRYPLTWYCSDVDLRIFTGFSQRELEAVCNEHHVVFTHDINAPNHTDENVTFWLNACYTAMIFRTIYFNFSTLQIMNRISACIHDMLRPQGFPTEIAYGNYTRSVSDTEFNFDEMPPVHPDVELFRVSTEHPAYGHDYGLGLRATQPIPPRTQIGGYAGDCRPEGFLIDRSFTLQLNSIALVDARDFCNEIRFVNDYRSTGNAANIDIVIRDNQAFYETNRRIEAGEELLADYGESYWAWINEPKFNCGDMLQYRGESVEYIAFTDEAEQFAHCRRGDAYVVVPVSELSIYGDYTPEEHVDVCLDDGSVVMGEFMLRRSETPFAIVAVPNEDGTYEKLSNVPLKNIRKRKREREPEQKKVSRKKSRREIVIEALEKLIAEHPATDPPVYGPVESPILLLTGLANCQQRPNQHLKEYYKQGEILLRLRNHMEFTYGKLASYIVNQQTARPKMFATLEPFCYVSNISRRIRLAEFANKYPCVLDSGLPLSTITNAASHFMKKNSLK
jgi:hypothetical protein